jgi:hypothetical protein
MPEEARFLWLDANPDRLIRHAANLQNKGCSIRRLTPHITGPAVMTLHLKPAQQPAPVHAIVRRHRQHWLAELLL